MKTRYLNEEGLRSATRIHKSVKYFEVRRYLLPCILHSFGIYTWINISWQLG